jgi:hypothetical protein
MADSTFVNTAETVGASLLAIAVDLSMLRRLTGIHREQARSHRGLVVDRFRPARFSVPY